MKIGILGLAGSGKDTLAIMLKDMTGLQILKYASKLKNATREVFGDAFDEREGKDEQVLINPDDMLEITFNMLSTVLTDKELVKAGDLYAEHLGLKRLISPREYQQLLGTDVGRAVADDIWTRTIRNYRHGCVISDVRFPNELVDVNIWVKRDSVYNPEATDVHTSEKLANSLHTDSDPYGVVDHIITNNGTFDDLMLQAVDLVKTLGLEIQD